jgi:hypothetical protein
METQKLLDKTEEILITEEQLRPSNRIQSQILIAIGLALVSIGRSLDELATQWKRGINT